MSHEHIMIVDDDELVRSGFAVNLKQMGYTVSTAESAEQALDLLDREPVQLILSDLMMGEMDGLQLLAQVRQHTDDIGFILITGFGTVDRAIEAVRQGADDFIQKPAQPEHLQERVRSVLDDIRLRRRLVADRKRSRRRSKIEQVRKQHNVRMSAIRQLAAGMADYVEKSMTSNDVMAAEALHRLTRDLKIIAHCPPQALGPIDPAALLSTCFDEPTIRTLQRTAPTVQLHSAIPDSLPQIQGSPLCLKAMLRNLVTFSASGMTQGGAITVRVEVSQFPPASSNSSQDCLLIKVTDMCPAPPLQDMQQAFEPFQARMIDGYTDSTALTLTAIQHIAEVHGGYIEIDVKPRFGTEYRIYLPTLDHEDTADGTSKEWSGTESILILDDNAAEGETAKKLLSGMGYQVEVIASGREAIALFEGGHGAQTTYDLIILDLILGDTLDGIDVYEQILKHCPKQRAIIASGFTEYSRIIEGRRLGLRRYIQKPYEADALGQAVRSELSRS